MTKGNSSQFQSAASRGSVSLGNVDRRFPNGICPQPALCVSPEPASLNDDGLIRAAIASSIKHSSRSVDEIADTMSLLLGLRVTSKMLYGYSAGSMQPNRIPASWVRAFCAATDNDSLLRCSAELAGFRLLTAAESELLELGREYLHQKRAAEKLAIIEKRLAEVEL